MANTAMTWREYYVQHRDELPDAVRLEMQRVWDTGVNNSGVWVRYKEVENLAGIMAHAYTHRPIKTNADRIRGMTNEELSYWLFNNNACVDFPSYKCKGKTAAIVGSTGSDRRWIMAILIKNLQMPENCFDCPCSDTEFNECKAAYHYTLHKDEYGTFDGVKPDWCPLVEIKLRAPNPDMDKIMEDAGWE